MLLCFHFFVDILSLISLVSFMHISHSARVPPTPTRGLHMASALAGAVGSLQGCTAPRLGVAEAVWGAQDQLSVPTGRRRPGRIFQVTQFPNPTFSLQANCSP